MLVQCDASQLEWRVLLELAQDEVGIAEILGGEDTHSKNQAAFNLPSRLIAKIFLFRTIYRGSGWSFANDPDFMHVSKSSSFWDQKNEAFYSKYLGINNAHYKWADRITNSLPIEGPFGRSWSINMQRDKYGNLKIPWTTLTNYPVQGTGADVMMFARIAAFRRIMKLGIVADFVSTVHDSIVVDTKKEYVQAIVNIFHEVFDDLPKMFKQAFGYTWRVPMDCECKMGMNMKEMTKVKRTA
jgi:DNA polymerase I-like protein with 3'-5' exonuclease and polymerase domains